MRIQISCFATLSEFTPSEGQMEIQPGSTARDVIHKLKIPEKDVKIIFVNGQNADPETVLHDHDRVGFFPAIGGG